MDRPQKGARRGTFVGTAKFEWQRRTFGKRAIELAHPLKTRDVDPFAELARELRRELLQKFIAVPFPFFALLLNLNDLPTDDSVYRWIEQKGLPAHRVGRLWKFKLLEIDEWARAGGAGQDEPDQGKENR